MVVVCSVLSLVVRCLLAWYYVCSLLGLSAHENSSAGFGDFSTNRPQTWPGSPKCGVSCGCILYIMVLPPVPPRMLAVPAGGRGALLLFSAESKLGTITIRHLHADTMSVFRFPISDYLPLMFLS